MSDVIREIKTSRKVVALTFDACWSGPPGRYDARIAEILEKEKIPATFLLSGVWARRFPLEVKSLSASPLFEIGNHSWDHTRFGKISENQMRWQLEQTEGILQKLTGKRSKLFRPPFGENTPGVERVATAAKMSVLLWSVDGSSDRSIAQVGGRKPGTSGFYRQPFAEFKFLAYGRGAWQDH